MGRILARGMVGSVLTFKEDLFRRKSKSEGPEDPDCFLPPLSELQTRGWDGGAAPPGWGDSAGAPGVSPGRWHRDSWPRQQCSSASSPLTVLDSLQPSTDILPGQLTQSPHSPVMNTLCSEAATPLRPWLCGSRTTPGMHTVYEGRHDLIPSEFRDATLNGTSRGLSPPLNRRCQLLNTFCQLTRHDESEYKTICN